MATNHSVTLSLLCVYDRSPLLPKLFVLSTPWMVMDHLFEGLPMVELPPNFTAEKVYVSVKSQYYGTVCMMSLQWRTVTSYG